MVAPAASMRCVPSATWRTESWISRGRAAQARVRHALQVLVQQFEQLGQRLVVALVGSRDQRGGVARHGWPGSGSLDGATCRRISADSSAISKGLGR